MRLPATAINSHRCDYDCDNISRSAILVLFQTLNSKVRWRKISGFDRNSYTRQLSGFRSFRIKVPDSKSPKACPNRGVFTNYLITESEVVTGKSQTSAYPFDLAIARSIRQGLGLRFSRNDLTLGY